MKTITISAHAIEVNELLQMVQQTTLLLKTADGSQFVLTSMADLQAFYVGDSDELENEVSVARANQALMKFLDERAAQAQPGIGIPLAEVRRQLAGWT